MSQNQLTFRIHAIQRMFQRRISLADVHLILKTGEIIESYPDDTPFPSRLILGWCGERPLHLVVANNRESQETIVITVYEPDLTRWKLGFKERRNE